MSENDGGTRRYRAGDADRDRVVEQLRRHHADGRLTAEEFQERMETALAARYVDELPPLLADLPSQDEPRNAGAGAGPAGAPWTSRARAGKARGLLPLCPVLPLLALFAVAGSVGAVAHGHFPWPLLWVGLGVWWFRGRAVRRWLRSMRG